MFTWLSWRKAKAKKRSETEEPVTAEVIEPEKVGGASSQGHSNSIRALFRTAIADAKRIAESIRTGAEKESQAEAGRILAQAELEAQKIKGEAEIAAQQQAEKIISEARKQAEIASLELKHRALQLLISAGEEVNREINEDYSQAYSRLSSSLQSLMTEAENIERAMKEKTTSLLERKTLELKDFETALLDTQPATTPVLETTKESAPEPDITETTEELTIEDEPAVETVEKPVTEKAEEPVAEAVVELVAESVEEPVVGIAEEEPVAEAVVEPVAGTAAEPVAIPGEEPVAERIEEPSRTKEESVAAAMDKPDTRQNRKKRDNGVAEKRPRGTIIDQNTLQSGTIELSIASPVELKLVSKLYNFLQTVPELRILYTRGSWDRGTTITVILEKAMPLVGILSGAPDFKVTARLLEAAGQAVRRTGISLRGEERAMQRIELILEEK